MGYYIQPDNLITSLWQSLFFRQSLCGNHVLFRQLHFGDLYFSESLSGATLWCSDNYTLATCFIQTGSLWQPCMCCSDNYTLATCIFQKVSQGQLYTLAIRIFQTGSQGQLCVVQTSTLWQSVLFRQAYCGNHVLFRQLHFGNLCCSDRLSVATMCCSDNYTLATCDVQTGFLWQPCVVQTTTLWQPVMFRQAFCGNVEMYKNHEIFFLSSL